MGGALSDRAFGAGASHRPCLSWLSVSALVGCGAGWALGQQPGRGCVRVGVRFAQGAKGGCLQRAARALGLSALRVSVFLNLAWTYRDEGDDAAFAGQRHNGCLALKFFAFFIVFLSS